MLLEKRILELHSLKILRPIASISIVTFKQKLIVKFARCKSNGDNTLYATKRPSRTSKNWNDFFSKTCRDSQMDNSLRKLLVKNSQYKISIVLTVSIFSSVLDGQELRKYTFLDVCPLYHLEKCDRSFKLVAFLQDQRNRDLSLP